jgi:DNA-binding XRE family transcriptional regulator
MRKMSRLTQAEFAAHRGISLPTLKQIERGTGSPKTATLVKIARYFWARRGVCSQETRVLRRGCREIRGVSPSCQRRLADDQEPEVLLR